MNEFEKCCIVMPGVNGIHMESTTESTDDQDNTDKTYDVKNGPRTNAITDTIYFYRIFIEKKIHKSVTRSRILCPHCVP